MEDTDDVVDAFLIDRETGIGSILQNGDDFFPAVVYINGCHIHPGRHGLGSGYIRKIYGISDQLALVLFQDILFFCRFYDGGKLLHLLFRVLFDLFPFERGRQKGDQKDHDPDQGPEQDHQSPDGVGIADSLAAGVLFGGDLWNGLSEDDHGHGNDGCGDPGIFIVSGDQDDRYGAQRRAGDIDQVVADQDGTQGVIEMGGYIEGQSCLFIALVPFAFQTHGIAGGIGHLGARKESGEIDAEDDAGNDNDSDHASSPPFVSASILSAGSFTETRRMRLCSILATDTFRS